MNKSGFFFYEKMLNAETAILFTDYINCYAFCNKITRWKQNLFVNKIKFNI